MPPSSCLQNPLTGGCAWMCVRGKNSCALDQRMRLVRKARSDDLGQSRGPGQCQHLRLLGFPQVPARRKEAGRGKPRPRGSSGVCRGARLGAAGDARASPIPVLGAKGWASPGPPGSGGNRRESSGEEATCHFSALRRLPPAPSNRRPRWPPPSLPRHSRAGT